MRIEDCRAEQAVPFVKKALLLESRLFTKEAADSVSGFLDRSGSQMKWTAAYDDQDMVGVIGGDPSGRHISLIMVLPDMQNCGIGTRLVKKWLEDSEEIQKVSANVLETARGFYEKAGFAVTGDSVSASGLKLVPMEYLCGWKNLGRKVKVIIDHPWGSFHPVLPDVIFRCNFGYTEESLRMDDLQEAYVCGPEEPLETFTGYVVGIIYHRGEDTTRWIVTPSLAYNKEEIINVIGETEQVYDVRIEWY